MHVVGQCRALLEAVYALETTSPELNPGNTVARRQDPSAMFSSFHAVEP